MTFEITIGAIQDLRNILEYIQKEVQFQGEAMAHKRLGSRESQAVHKIGEVREACINLQITMCEQLLELKRIRHGIMRVGA